MRNAYSEFQIEEFIWSKINDLQYLADRGLDMNKGLYFRQYTVPGCGVFDIVCFSVKVWISEAGDVQKNLIVEVYELKRDEIKCCDVGQISRYMDCLRANEKEFLRHIGFDGFELTVFGYLIGNGIERDAMHTKALVDGLMSVYPYEFSPATGVLFNPMIADNALWHKHRKINIPKIESFSLSDIEESGGVETIDFGELRRYQIASGFSNN